MRLASVGSAAAGRRGHPLISGLGWGDVTAGLGFARALVGLLRRPLTPATARASLAARRGRRASDFLALVHRGVFGDPASPYARLLHHAGCESGDLDRLVRTEGVEGALATLFRSGVYLTVEELKGRRPIVRGTRVLGLVTPGELRNPLARRHLPVQSGGSGGAATRVGWDLAFIRERAADLCLVHHATGGDRRRPAVWGVPGSGAIIHLLDTSAFGSVPERWFSQLDPRAPRIPSRYRVSVHAVLWTSRLAGVPLPAPIHAPVEDPSPVLRWMQAVLRRGDRPYLFGYVTSMLRLCAEAQASGVDLDGVEIGTGGEPVTAVRRLAMERAGARVFPRYAAIEAGLIADACRHPAEPDDMHLLDDLVAAIQPGPAGAAAGLPPDALLVSSLRPSAPLLLINVSMGDQVVLAERACGCPLEALGWPTHLHSVRSFEKLTGTGATFLDVDVVGILERILPARFGGSALDYQLVEEAERRDGQPSVALVVHPRLGPLDVGELKQALLDALAGDGGAGAVMAAMWRAAGFLRVERRPPSATAAGKVLHVHRPDGHHDGHGATGGRSPAHSAPG